jgi:hypothetical protein
MQMKAHISKPEIEEMIRVIVDFAGETKIGDRHCVEEDEETQT